MLAGCWQHPHQLVEGAEGPPQVEGDGQGGQVDKVARKGGVVEGVEPVEVGVCVCWGVGCVGGGGVSVGG